MIEFAFYKKLSVLSCPLDSIMAVVPQDIEDELFLFKYYEKLLEMEGNFGKNWDAFFDNLKTLSFFTGKNLYLIHEDVPFQNSSDNRRIYIEILIDSINHWQLYPEHKIYVYFHENFKTFVTPIVNNYTSHMKTI